MVTFALRCTHIRTIGRPPTPRACASTHQVVHTPTRVHVQVHIKSCTHPPGSIVKYTSSRAPTRPGWPYRSGDLIEVPTRVHRQVHIKSCAHPPGCMGKYTSSHTHPRLGGWASTHQVVGTPARVFGEVRIKSHTRSHQGECPPARVPTPTRTLWRCNPAGCPPYNTTINGVFRVPKRQ